MNKLLKDAIADAKAVRETAMANAKIALQEAFAPKIQSMLSHKIKEEMEGEEEEPVEEDEEMTMDASSEEETATESRWRKNTSLYEDEDEEVEDEEVEDEEVEEEETEEEDEMSDEEIEEILRELEGDDEEEMTEGDDEEEMTEEDEMSDEEEAPKTEARRKKKKMMENEEESSKEDEEVSIEEIIRALREGDDEEEMTEEDDKTEEELEEAYRVIKYLRVKLNEVNLLNAKLLYVNKLFKKTNLTESKKFKIVETFDRVKSVREAKLVYATLSESLAAATIKKPIKSSKNSLKENFASRSSKGTRVINESNQVVNRFKELVNYNKNNY